MRIDERTSLLIRSRQFTPKEISGFVGLEPDESVDMTERPQARAHVWELTGGRNVDAGISTLSEDLAALAQRLRPYVEHLAAIDRNQTTCAIHVSRRFYSDAREASVGWGLDAEVIRLLYEAGLHFDVDEYDFSSYDDADVDENWSHGFDRLRAPRIGDSRLGE